MLNNLNINKFCHEKTKLKLNTKYYYDAIWIFDLNCKFNGFFLKNKYLSLNLNIFFSTPFMPLVHENLVRIWLLLNSIKICKFFTHQNATIKKLLTTLKKTKKITIAIIQTKVWKQKSFTIMSEFNLMILPYLKFSSTIKQFWLFCDNTGGLSFFFNEIVFFTSFLDENFIGWNKNSIISMQLFSFFKKNIWLVKYLNFFFLIPFIFSMTARIIWSSLGFCCQWGHGGWSDFNFIKNLSITAFNWIKYKFCKYYY